jgi:AraC-like DNA-binding protein
MFSNEPISEVALHLGFEDPSYFSRFFKRGAHVSPGEFRRALARHGHLPRKSTSAP